MADTKDGESFFRKVVRFVANPATDWADLATRQDDQTREIDLEQSELKAMVERKRRNDFVRKREFDMLRKVRREGLSPEQLAALGSSSRLDDSEARQSESASARPEGGVKAKIDEIEQQMVGAAYAPSGGRRNSGFFNAPTEPAVLARTGLPPPSASVPLDAGREELPALPPLPEHDDIPARPPAPVYAAPGLPPLAPLSLATAGDTGEFEHRFGVEVSEVVHDPELDEAVIAFANADFNQCEQSLSQLTGAGGARSQHAETWLVLFDLYRATGQQQRFEALASDYAHQFGWSAPQWFSLPKLVSDAVAEAQTERSGGASAVQGDVGWVCPEVLDIDAVARLRSQTLQMPLPWVFDWSASAQHRSRGGDAAVGAVPALGQAAAGNALDVRRDPVRHAAGGRAHRRARCRPGLLAGAPGCVAAGQPGRPVRRGGHRLLRHLRGVAAVLGAHALQRARCRLHAQHAHAAAVDGQPGVDRVHGIGTDRRQPQRHAGGQHGAVGAVGGRHRQRRSSG